MILLERAFIALFLRVAVIYRFDWTKFHKLWLSQFVSSAMPSAKIVLFRLSKPPWLYMYVIFTWLLLAKKWYVTPSTRLAWAIRFTRQFFAGFFFRGQVKVLFFVLNKVEFKTNEDGCKKINSFLSLSLPPSSGTIHFKTCLNAGNNNYLVI